MCKIRLQIFLKLLTHTTSSTRQAYFRHRIRAVVITNIIQTFIYTCSLLCGQYWHLVQLLSNFWQLHPVVSKKEFIKLDLTASILHYILKTCSKHYIHSFPCFTYHTLSFRLVQNLSTHQVVPLICILLPSLAPVSRTVPVPQCSTKFCCTLLHENKPLHVEKEKKTAHFGWKIFSPLT